MFLDWLLKTEEDSISYDELKMLHKTDQDGVSEDGNLPFMGRILQQQQTD